ncbi:MAG TPA: PQQ-dependent sugar dehydrogenase [Pirellulales bacterium]
MTLRCAPTSRARLTRLARWTRLAALGLTVAGLSFAAPALAPLGGHSLVAAELDATPLPVKSAQAFSELEVARPIVLTHAGDGSNRVFVASQLGKIYVFPNKDDVAAEEIKVFCDLEPQVVYNDKQNEEGLLGLAFHPKYKENGQFFVYYTSRKEPQLSVISRFTVSKDDPNRADPKTEEVLMQLKQPAWNHNGGTVAFGPDGYLYIAFGDGGKANDVFGNSQRPDVLFAKVLRIDVDSKSGDKPYGIPKDNPFVGDKAFAPETYAWGFRNPWRFSFDRETGALWLADVGQDKWEEIDIVEKGGNYGWNKREGLHKFTEDGEPKKGEWLDPVFEYPHEVGKSITGGHVYRGKAVPELVGKYLYADYVAGKIWALDYDAAKKTVKGNHPVGNNVLPVMSFGEDEQGDVYYMVPQGRISRFVSAK